MRTGQLEAWTLTLVVEGVAAAAMARAFGVEPSRAARAAIAGSLVSHPVVWWLFYCLVYRIGYWPTFAVVEGFAVLSETPFYRLAGASWPRALLLSFLVNASSVLVGFARQWLG
jgi:hypothetical protein